jgi:hypothetical protein
MHVLPNAALANAIGDDIFTTGWIRILEFYNHMDDVGLVMGARYEN